MTRPNSNPARLNDCRPISSRGVNSPNPLGTDYRGGMEFGITSPGWSKPGSPSPDKGQGQFNGSSGLSGSIDYLKKC